MIESIVSFIFGFFFGSLVGITIVAYVNIRRYERSHK